jgi:hypothetical protein
VAVHAALKGLAMKAAEGIVTIHKKPVAGGGYVYEITISEPRARV